MKILTVTYPGYDSDKDAKIAEIVGASSTGGGFFFLTQKRDLEFEVDDFHPETQGRALTELGAEWQTEEAEEEG